MFTPGEILCFKEGRLGGDGYFQRMAHSGVRAEDVHVIFLGNAPGHCVYVEHEGRQGEIHGDRLKKIEFLPYDPNQQPFNEDDI